MDQENEPSRLPGEGRSSSPRPLSTRSATSSSSRSTRPHYITVGSGSTSASAAALMADIERDSGYGSMSSDNYTHNGLARGWHPGLTEDQPTPSHTPTYLSEYNPEIEKERRVFAGHIHQMYYNQNRSKLGRSITQTVDTLRQLQEMNSTWPAQYPNVHQLEKDPNPTGSDPRPGLQHTHSTAVAGDIRRQKDNVPFRPSAPRRAGTSLGEGSTATSSAAAEQTDQEPERLITPQAAHDFSVLKLDLKIQGLTQAEIAHSLEKSSVARILNGKIDSITRHLVRLRERIDDTSSKVLVTGDLNAGKSTFCNALLRRKILPEDEQPCTSVFCEVLDARENAGIEEAHAIHKETIYDRNDESTYDVFSLFELETVVSDSTHYTQCKVYVKDIRAIDESLLNNGVVDISIIDAPGLNSDSLKTTAVFARQEEIDVVVFVVNAANHFTLSAKEFIWNAAVEKAYIFVVVNGYDNIKNKTKCQTAVLEQLQGLSPRTFKESSELVHFVSSNAIPVAPPPGPPNGGSGGGSGGYSDPPDEHPSPMDEDEPLGKHGEPGSPPNKGKGKDKEKVQDFEQLEGALRRFVLEKRARSKLAPAKTYLLNILTDLNALATVNRDVAQSELDRVTKELEKLEPAFEQSKKARSEVSDQVDTTIEDTCADIYSHTRSTLTNTITHIAEADLGVPYDGLWNAFQYAEGIKFAMLDKIAASVTTCEDNARKQTMLGLSGIKSLGILHLGDKFAEVNFRPVDDMFTRRKDLLAREVDTEIQILDFFDISALWSDKQEKVATTSMALTAAGVLGGRMVGGVGWIDGALGAAKVLGTKNLRLLFVPGLITAVLLTATYTLLSLPRTLPHRLSARLSTTLENMDYIHLNSRRISEYSRRRLNAPATDLRSSLQKEVHDLGERRDGTLKIKRESEVARKYFGNLVRESAEGKRSVEAVDLDGPAPGVAGGYDEGEMATARL
ncbi:MAG: hypothetical protein LQ337_006238 [Flavoplaca oasis]|nr:MAG: hypothetical protein LQ337_006238 [Flavoplaca oasis]